MNKKSVPKKTAPKRPALSGKDLNCLAFQEEVKIHPALHGYLGYLFSRAALTIRGELERALLPLGLQIHQFGILTILGSGTNFNQNQIGEELGVDKASMVKVLDNLEALEYVERVTSKEDRRVKYVHLTAKGKKALAQGQVLRQKKEDEVFSFLSAKEKAQFRDVIFRLLISLNKLPQKPTV